MFKLNHKLSIIFAGFVLSGVLLVGCGGKATSTNTTSPTDKVMVGESAKEAVSTSPSPVAQPTMQGHEAHSTAGKEASTKPASAKPSSTKPTSNIVPTPANETTALKETTPAVKTFTLQELKQYNGQNGNPAYVAIDGIVYDMTNSKLWKKGAHNGYEAGNDLSDFIKNSPHGKSTLGRVPEVGRLVK